MGILPHMADMTVWLFGSSSSEQDADSINAQTELAISIEFKKCVWAMLGPKP